MTPHRKTLADLSDDGDAQLSMCLIARNEQTRVRRCFGSFWPHVDEVVLVDTGSDDDTIGEAQRFAADQPDAGKLIVGHFDWCDDFAAARNYAESLASCEYVCNTDLDETVVGAEHLRGVCSLLTPDVGSETGANLLYFDNLYFGAWEMWERLARRGAFPWVRRVDEIRQIRGGVGIVKRDVCHWLHHRQEDERSVDRYVPLAETMVREAPECPDAQLVQAVELRFAGRLSEALARLDRYAERHPTAAREIREWVLRLDREHDRARHGSADLTLNQSRQGDLGDA